MKQKHKNNRKRPKPKENQPGILKFYAFCQKIQQKTSGPGKRCWCYVSMRMHPKNRHTFTLKVAWTLLSGSHSHSQCQGYVLTLQALAYIKGKDRTSGPIWNDHRNPDILEKVLNWITLSNSTAGKCTPMQVIKQAEHGRTSTTEEQKLSSFQANYDS